MIFDLQNVFIVKAKAGLKPVKIGAIMMIMINKNHKEHSHIKFQPVKVWIDVDPGIADFVTYLNMQPDVRTGASCQGWPPCGCGNCEGCPANVLVAAQTEDAKTWLKRFDSEKEHTYTGWWYIYPTAKDLEEATEFLAKQNSLSTT